MSDATSRRRGSAERISRMSAAERLFMEACINPPTTAEWVTFLRRTRERKMFWNGKQWHWRMRPFICPHTFPLDSVTAHGYWWSAVALRRLRKIEERTPAPGAATEKERG
jgi:hypothetical protein